MAANRRRCRRGRAFHTAQYRRIVISSVLTLQRDKGTKCYSGDEPQKIIAMDIKVFSGRAETHSDFDYDSNYNYDYDSLTLTLHPNEKPTERRMD